MFLFLALNKQDWIWWMGLTKPEGLVALHFFPLSNSKQFSLHDIWWISKWVLNYVYVKFLYYSNDFIFHRNDLQPSFTHLWIKLLFNFKIHSFVSLIICMFFSWKNVHIHYTYSMFSRIICFNSILCFWSLMIQAEGNH